jgi:dCMP deaminase
MATQQQLDKVYMQNAINMATLSHAVRKKVGCILVTPENLQIGAYNGQPSGWDNCCEDVHESEPFEYLVTKTTVIHSELNAILHAARQSVSVKDSTIYVSLAPCSACSAMIAQAGIKRVVYAEDYRDMSGITLLREHGIAVEQIIDNR